MGYFTETKDKDLDTIELVLTRTLKIYLDKKPAIARKMVAETLLYLITGEQQ